MRSRTRLAYLAGNGFEAWIAVAAVLSATAFFVDPTYLARSSVGQALHPFDYVWTIGYGAAGLLIVLGLAFARPRYEAAGLSMLASAVLVNVLAIAAVRGITGIASILTYAGIALACASRVHTLLVASNGNGPLG